MFTCVGLLWSLVVFVNVKHNQMLTFTLYKEKRQDTSGIYNAFKTCIRYYGETIESHHSPFVVRWQHFFVVVTRGSATKRLFPHSATIDSPRLCWSHEDDVRDISTDLSLSLSLSLYIYIYIYIYIYPISCWLCHTGTLFLNPTNDYTDENLMKISKSFHIKSAAIKCEDHEQWSYPIVQLTKMLVV